MSSIEVAEEMYETGEYLGSLGLVLKILEEEPDNLRALEMKASLCCIKNRLPEAIRAYKRLLRFYESDEKVWAQLFILGSISFNYRLLKDLDKAINYCERSVKLCERFLKIDGPHREYFADELSQLFWVLGDCQYKSSKYPGAVDTYVRFLRLLSEFGCLEAIADVLYELACAYYKLNRTTEALSKYSETLKIHGVLGQTLYTSWTHYYVASIHFAAHDYEKALFHVEKCVLLMVKIYGKNIFVGIEDDPVYKRAKRLQNSLKKNKFLWKKYR